MSPAVDDRLDSLLRSVFVLDGCAGGIALLCKRLCELLIFLDAIVVIPPLFDRGQKVCFHAKDGLELLAFILHLLPV